MWGDRTRRKERRTVLIIGARHGKAEGGMGGKVEQAGGMRGRKAEREF